MFFSRHVLPAVALLLPAALGACALNDSRIADGAKTSLLGLSEVELESCLGVPDQHASFGSTDVLTYYATSSSSTSYSIPIVGGLGFSNGGYCHATFRVDGGRVSRITYSGEKNGTLAPNAYCAPILRSCVAWLADHPAARTVPASTADATRTGTASAAVPPGASSAAPQPQASVAAVPANIPTATPR